MHESRFLLIRHMGIASRFGVAACSSDQSARNWSLRQLVPPLPCGNRKALTQISQGSTALAWRELISSRIHTGNSGVESNLKRKRTAVSLRRITVEVPSSQRQAKLAPHRGHVSNFGGVPAASDQGGLPTDSDPYGSVILVNAGRLTRGLMKCWREALG